MAGNSQSEFTVKIHTFIPRNSKIHFTWEVPSSKANVCNKLPLGKITLSFSPTFLNKGKPDSITT